MVLLLVKGGKRCVGQLLFAYFESYGKKEIGELSKMRNSPSKE